MKVLPAIIPSPAVMAAREHAHQLAFERQSGCRLLRLPLEIREKIWHEVLTGNVIHISKKPNQTSSHSSAFSHNYCRCPDMLSSSAAPAGKSDHANCIYYGLSNFGSIRLTCKQIRMELPDSLEDLLYSQNALHFNSLEEANEYLFGLSERRRCIITYLRFSVPDCFGSSIFKDEAVYWHWLGLMNYFSCPWDRETVSPSVHFCNSLWLDEVVFPWNHPDINIS